MRTCVGIPEEDEVFGDDGWGGGDGGGTGEERMSETCALNDIATTTKMQIMQVVTMIAVNFAAVSV